MQAAAATGDSFLRVLLNVAPIQPEVARLLVERLASSCEPDAGDEAGLPQLILGQFRWWVLPALLA